MAHFNYQSTPAHPRKVQRLMREFLEDASTLTYFDDDLEMEIQRSISLRKGKDGFCTDPTPEDESTVVIFYDFTDLDQTKTSPRVFNQNVRARASFTRGIADVTIALLHELGHNAVFGNLPKGFNRNDELINIFAATRDNFVLRCQMYCDLPDEWAATQWAIDWLSDPENRRKARAFERAFFKAWRGE